MKCRSAGFYLVIALVSFSSTFPSVLNAAHAQVYKVPGKSIGTGCPPFCVYVYPPLTVNIVTSPSGPYVSKYVSVSVDVRDSSNGEASNSTIQLFVDSASSPYASSSISPYTFSLDTTQFSDGSHTLIVNAKSGLSSGSSQVTLTFDNTAPSASITSPTPGQSISSSSFPVTVSTTDATSGVAKVELYVDLQPTYYRAYETYVAPPVPQASSSSPPFSLTLDTTKFPDGNHTLTAVSYDKANNTGSSSALPVIFDNTPPVLVLPSDITVQATNTSGMVVTYNVTATDNLDPKVSAVCTPQSGSVFPAGATTTVACTATDTAHNTAKGSFHVTVLPPSTSTGNSPFITVRTDKSSIISGTDKLTISGQVFPTVEGQQVQIQFRKPDGTQSPSEPVPITSMGGTLYQDGTYALPPASFSDVGQWNVVVSYNGTTSNTSFSVVPSILPPQITISMSTEKSSYTYGEYPRITGQISPTPAGLQTVSLKILNPDSTVLGNAFVQTNADGSFFFNGSEFGQGEKPGAYTITATYSGVSSSTSIQLVAPNISLQTDKQNYLQGDVMGISGRVEPIVSGESISITIIGPTGMTFGSYQAEPDSSGTFSLSIPLNGATSGLYTVQSTYDSTYYPVSTSLQVPVAFAQNKIHIDISASPDLITLVQSQSGSNATIHLSASSENPGPVDLVLNAQWQNSSISGLTASFDTNRITQLSPGTSRDIKLSVKTVLQPPVGNTTLRISALTNEVSQSKQQQIAFLDFPVHVLRTPTFDYALSSSAASVTLSQGNTNSEAIVEAHLISGAPATTSLNVTVLPPGLSAVLERASGIPSFESRLTLSSTEATTPGEYKLTITGTSDGGSGVAVKRTTSLYVDILPSTFSLEVEPVDLHIKAGQSGDINVKVIPTGANAQNVVLSTQSHSNLLTESLTEDHGVPSFSSIMHVSSSESIKPGSYPIAVLAATANESRIETFTLIVDAPKEILVSSEPRILTINVDGVAVPSSQQGQNFSWYGGEIHSLSAPLLLDLGNGTRYAFSSWNDGEKSQNRTISVSDSASITARYRTQYLLKINSEVGQPIGSGWYDAGTEPSFAVRPDSNPLIKYNFEGWSVSPTDKINGPCSPLASATGVAYGQGNTQPYATVSDNKIALGRMANDNLLYGSWMRLPLAYAQQPDQGGNYQASGSSDILGKVCLDGPKFVVAKWRADYTILAAAGGGAAAATAAGVVAATKGGLFKPRRPKFPILTWQVYAPSAIQPGGGRAYIDVVLRNIGEVDAKDVKVSVEAPGLECEAPKIIETIMPWESTKFSFFVQTQSQNDPAAATARREYKVSVVLQSRFIPKKEAIAVVSANDVRFVPKKEETFTLVESSVNVTILGFGLPHEASFPNLASVLQMQGYGVREISSSSLDLPGQSSTAFASLADSQVLVLNLPRALPEGATLISDNTMYKIQQYVSSGHSAVVFGACLDWRLAQLAGYKLDPASGQTFNNLYRIENYGLRICDSDEPITRSFQNGDIFRSAITPGAPILLGLEPDHETIRLMDQLVRILSGVAMNDGKRVQNAGGVQQTASATGYRYQTGEYVTAPAVTQKQVGSGSVTLFNFSIERDAGALHLLIERALLSSAGFMSKQSLQEMRKETGAVQ